MNPHITTQRVRRSYGIRINVFPPPASAPQGSSRRWFALAHGRLPRFRLRGPCLAKGPKDELKPAAHSQILEICQRTDPIHRAFPRGVKAK
jgi:hypothetical protein